MINYIFRKLGYGLLVLWGVVTLVFFLFNLAPGDPVRNLVGENASQEVISNMRRKLDLDLPVGQRYLLYLNDLSPLAIHSENEQSRIFFKPSEYTGVRMWLRGEGKAMYLKAPYLKRSFLSDKSVSSILSEVMPGTVVLAVVSIGIALVLGLLLGIAAALKKDGFYDRLILFISALGMAGPSFFVAILVAWLGAVIWRDEVVVSWGAAIVLLALIAAAVVYNKRKSSLIWLLPLSIFVLVLFNFFHLQSTLVVLPGTGLNMTGSLYSVDVWEGEFLDAKNLILPVVTLLIRPLSVIVQLTRSSLLDVMQQDYIRTARAKGLSEWEVIFRHALRNALNPVITAVSGWFASLLAGAIFVEFVFGWKGLGQQMFTAIENQDMPVVMGGVIVISAAFVLINMLVDLLYAWIDPRVRMS
ncbi:MAG: ABC transporter permease [Flavobacteriales bacterium]